jgi:hypothetical protein
MAEFLVMTGKSLRLHYSKRDDVYFAIVHPNNAIPHDVRTRIYPQYGFVDLQIFFDQI